MATLPPQTPPRARFDYVAHLSAITPPNFELSPNSILTSTPFRRRIKHKHPGAKDSITPPPGTFRHLISPHPNESSVSFAQRIKMLVDVEVLPKDKVDRFLVYDHGATTLNPLKKRFNSLAEKMNESERRRVEGAQENRLKRLEFARRRYRLFDLNTRASVIKWAINDQNLTNRLRTFARGSNDQMHQATDQQDEIRRLFSQKNRYIDGPSPSSNPLPFTYEPYYGEIFARIKPVRLVDTLLLEWELLTCFLYLELGPAECSRS